MTPWVRTTSGAIARPERGVVMSIVPAGRSSQWVWCVAAHGEHVAGGWRRTMAAAQEAVEAAYAAWRENG